MKACINCSAQLAEDKQYCNECGISFSESLVCELHPEKPAKCICAVCSKPACELCAVKIDNRWFCPDPGHPVLIQDNDILCHPESEFEALALVSNLAAAGITARYFSLHDHAASRWLDEERSFLFVKKTELKQASMVLTGLGLMDKE